MARYDRRACAVTNAQLHKQERLIQSKLARNPRDMRLASKLKTIKRQIIAEQTKCMAEARRERQVRDAEARAERRQFKTQHAQSREEARRARIQTRRESFELRRARKEAGEITGRDVTMYGGLAVLGVGGLWLASILL